MEPHPNSQGDMELFRNDTEFCKTHLRNSKLPDIRNSGILEFWKSAIPKSRIFGIAD